MSVFVDSHFTGFGSMIMCHMIADTPAELHEMAAAIGVRRRWFQYTRFDSLPHYDICKTKRAAAIKRGALQIDRQGMVARIRAHRARPDGAALYVFERQGLRHPGELPRPSHCPACDRKSWIRYSDDPPLYHCEACSWPRNLMPE